ncbi:uncharacterized protein LOC134225272 [Armigeres subalbatus]|uniref:uncharacterized protein LOC134225272 n=1 Tax=Armigeres subalbatus TaxID=124917 RepID=UPI002ED1ADAF
MKIAPIVLLLGLIGVCLADPFMLLGDVLRQQRALARNFRRYQRNNQAILMGNEPTDTHHRSHHVGRHLRHHTRHHARKQRKKDWKTNKYMRLHFLASRLHQRGQQRRLQRLRDWGKWFG